MSERRALSQQMAVTETHPSLESLQRRFSELTGVVDLPLDQGAYGFFSAWHAHGRSRESGAPPLVAHVPVLPRDSILYSCPFDELHAASLRAGRELADREIEELASRHRIAREVLYSPTHTISGGESVLVCLARASILLPRVNHLVLCSPNRWLSRENRTVSRQVLDTYLARGKTVSVLCLDGETEEAGPLTLAETAPDARAIAFSMELRSLTIALGAETYPHPSRSLSLRFDTEGNQALTLLSPCIWVGENGSGKSTLAHTLVGLVPRAGFIRCA